MGSHAEWSTGTGDSKSQVTLRARRARMAIRSPLPPRFLTGRSAEVPERHTDGRAVAQVHVFGLAVEELIEQLGVHRSHIRCQEKRRSPTGCVHPVTTDEH